MSRNTDEITAHIEEIKDVGLKVLKHTLGARRRKAQGGSGRPLSNEAEAGLVEANRYHYNSDLFEAIAAMIVAATG